MKRTLDRKMPPQHQSLHCILEKPPRFDKPHAIWTTLSRIRTSPGRHADALYKWSKTLSWNCNYGAKKQTIQHIMSEYQDRPYCNGNFADFLAVANKAENY